MGIKDRAVRYFQIKLKLYKENTKENTCKTVNDQPTVKAKKFQRETFQNVSRTVGINAQKTEKKKSVKLWQDQVIISERLLSVNLKTRLLELNIVKLSKMLNHHL